MKKIGLLFLVVIFILSLSCCKTVEGNRDTALSFSEKAPIERNADNIISCEQILEDQDSEKVSVISLIEDELIYSIGEDNNDDTADLVFHKYNSTNKKNEKIGTLKNGNVSTETYSINKSSKIFFSNGVVQEENVVNKHIMIDFKENSLTVLDVDDAFPPMVYTVFVDEDRYLEFQPKEIENGQYSYLISIFDINQNKKDLIIKKQSKAAPEYGEVITSVCCYSGIIYTFENCGENGEIKSYVCSYDTAGKLLKKTPINEITDFFEKNPNDTVFAISVFENHVIFQTLNGWLLGFKKTESGYEQIDALCGENLRLANTSEKINCNMKNIVLFSIETSPEKNEAVNHFYSYNIDTSEKTYLNICTENFSDVVYYKDCIVLVDKTGIWRIKVST